MRNVFLIIAVSISILSCKEKVEEKNDEFKPLTIVSCDAENILSDSSKFIAPTRLQSTTFIDATSQTSENAHTGKYSIKLNKVKPFGFTYSIDNVLSSDSFYVSVWRKSDGQKGTLVVSTEDSNILYISQNIGTNKDANGWELLSINAIIPEKATNKKLKIYVWNPDTSNVAYFDDLKIQYLNKPKVVNAQ